MSNSYKRPILSGIFDILGALVLIGAGIAIAQTDSDPISQLTSSRFIIQFSHD